MFMNADNLNKRRVEAALGALAAIVRDAKTEALREACQQIHEALGALSRVLARESQLAGQAALKERLTVLNQEKLEIMRKLDEEVSG